MGQGHGSSEATFTPTGAKHALTRRMLACPKITWYFTVIMLRAPREPAMCAAADIGADVGENK